MATKNVRRTQTRPSLPEVLPLAIRYGAKHGAWGLFHVQLDDGNTDDRFCNDLVAEALAKPRPDPDEVALAEVIEVLSTTQRRKLPHLVYRALNPTSR
jgi:hypothetical protein